MPITNVSVVIVDAYCFGMANGDAQIVKMVGFWIPDNPSSSIRWIPDRIRILNSTVFRSHVSSLVPWLTYVHSWIVIVKPGWN